MQKVIADRLLDLNHDFYRQFAAPFAESRSTPQPGFYRLIDYLPRPCDHLLDVGCGDGRLGRFLQEEAGITLYTGVDFSRELLDIAGAKSNGIFFQRNLSLPGCLDSLGIFDAITCLATLQHIPGKHNRIHLLDQMKQHIRPDGRIVLANWQFTESERQRRKIVSWSKIGLNQDDVEPHDYLLSWKRGGYGYRYVAYIGPKQLADLIKPAGLRILEQFYSDGREGNLNLYTILGPKN